MAHAGRRWSVVDDRDGSPVSVDFQEWRCHVVMERYEQGGGLSLRLVDAEDGASVARATSNLVGFQSEDDEVLIKNYAENTGILGTLVAAGLIEDTGRLVNSEYIDLNIVRLSPHLASQWHQFRDELNPGGGRQHG